MSRAAYAQLVEAIECFRSTNFVLCAPSNLRPDSIENVHRGIPKLRV